MKKHRIVGWKQRAKALSRSLLGASVLLAMLALGFAYRAPSMANAAALGVSNDISPAADTWVASGQPDANLFGAEQRWVGYDQAGGYQAERTFIAFGAFGLPSGSVITSASLQLYLSAWTSGDPLMTVSAYRVRTAWSDTLTWNQAKSLAVDAQPATSAPVASGQFGWYAWDVTAAAQDWLAHDDTPNLSFELRSDASEESGSQHERAFWSNECPPADCGSNRPQLVIQYQLPTPIPTATTATPTRTPSPTNTPTPTVTPTPTPGLQLTLRAAPSGPVREGQTITYTVGYQTSGQLDDVAINDQIPSGTYAITSSLRPPGTGGIALGNTVVIWELGEVYAGKGTVSFAVQVTPTVSLEAQAGPLPAKLSAQLSPPGNATARQTPVAATPMPIAQRTDVSRAQKASAGLPPPIPMVAATPLPWMVVINEGASASWNWNDNGYATRSNEVINGPTLYLPLIFGR